MIDLLDEYRAAHPNTPYSDAELIAQFGQLQDRDGRFNAYPQFLQSWSDQKKAYTAATAPSLGDDFSRGVSSGASSLLSTGQAALAAGSAAVGAKGARDYFLSKAEANEKSAAENAPSVSNFSDVHDWDTFSHWLSGASGQMLPQLAEMGITGAVGAAAGASAGTAVEPGGGTALGGAGGLVAGISERLAVKSLLKKFAEEGLADTLKPELAATVKSQLTSLAEKGAVRSIAPETERLLTTESRAIGANFGNHIAQFLNFYGQSAGGIYSDLAQNKDVDPDTALNTALLGGFAASVPAQFLPSYIGSKLFAGVKGADANAAKSAFYSYFARTASEATKTIPGGIAAMDMQQLATVAAEKYATGQPWTDADWKSLQNTTATGALMGATAAPLAALGGGSETRRTVTSGKATPEPPPLDAGVMKQIGVDINTPEGQKTVSDLQTMAQQDLDGALPTQARVAISSWPPEVQTQYRIIKGSLQNETKTVPASGGNETPPPAANPSELPPVAPATPATDVGVAATPAGDTTGSIPASGGATPVGDGNVPATSPTTTPAISAAPQTPILQPPSAPPKIASKVAENAARLRAASVGEESPKKANKPQVTPQVAPQVELSSSPESPVSPASETPPLSQKLPTIADNTDHPLLSQIGFDSIQPGAGTSLRGTKGTAKTTVPPFLGIPADAVNNPAKLSAILTSAARKTAGKNTDTNRATAFLAPDGQVHILPTYYTQTKENGKEVRLAPLPGEKKGGTLSEAIKKGYSPISSIYLRDSVNALDPNATHSFPNRESYERQIAQPARDRVTAARATAAAVASHITGEKGAVSDDHRTAGVGEASVGAVERPEFSDELAAGLHKNLKTGQDAEGALSSVALRGSAEEKADLRNLITQLVEAGHDRKSALEYVKSEIRRAYKDGGTREAFTKALSESQEGRTPGLDERPNPNGPVRRETAGTAPRPDATQPTRPVENPTGVEGQKGAEGNKEPHSVEPTVILSYGDRYVKEQGLPAAQARIRLLNDRISEDTAAGLNPASMIDEAENLRKAVTKAGGEVPLAGETRQSTTAPSIESTPSTQQSFQHVTQTLTESGVPVSTHQTIFASLVHDLAQTDRRPVAAGGGVYDRAAKTVAISLRDAAKPTAEDLRTLIEEAGHHVFASLPQTDQDRISAAIGSLTDEELRVRDYTKSANPKIQAEERLMSAVSNSLIGQGFDPQKSSGIAQAVVRFVKELYYKTTMAIQRAILGPNYVNGEIAQRYFQNRLESFLSRDQNTLSWIDRLGATKVSQQQRGTWRNPGTSPLFERLGNAGRIEYDHVPDSDLAAARFNNESLRFSTTPSPDEPTRQTEIEMRAALFNHAGDIIDKAAKLPAIAAIAKDKGVDASKLITDTLRLPAKAALLSTLNDERETTGQPVQFDPEKRITDFKAKSNADRLTVNAAQNTYDALGKISRMAVGHEQEIDDLQKRHDDLAEKLDAKQKNYLDSDMAKREMVGWTRDAVNDIYRRATGESRRIGAIEQQLRSMDPTGTIKDYAAVFKHLFTGDQLKGENLFGLLEHMALDPKLDFTKPIGEILGDMQGNVNYRDWLDNSKESKAILATAVAFAKLHGTTMANLELRRLTDVGERAAIAKSLADLKTEKGELSKSIPKLARSATLAERARAEYRSANNEVRTLSRRIDDRKLQVQIADAVAPVFAGAHSELANKLEMSGDFTLSNGAVYHVAPSPESSTADVSKSQKVLQLDATRKMTNPVELESDFRSNLAFLANREARAAAGDQDAKDVGYWTVKREMDALATHKNFSLNPAASDKWTWELKLLGEAPSVSEAYPSNEAKIIGRMDKVYTSEVGRYAHITEVQGRINDQLEDVLLAMFPKGTANSRQVLRQQILNPARAMFQRMEDLGERYADQPGKLRAAEFTRVESQLRSMASVAPLIGDRWPEFMVGLRKLLEHQGAISDGDAKRAAEYHGVLDPKLQIKNPATGAEEPAVRRHIPLGSLTFSQRLSDGFKVMLNALRETGWNSDETGQSLARAEFSKIPELYEGETKGQGHDAAMAQIDQIESRYFRDPLHGDQVTNHFVRDLVESDARSIWDAPSLDGVTKVPADPTKIRSQWEASNGSIRKFADGLYAAYTAERGEHVQTEGEYVGDVFNRLAGVSARIDKLMPYESKTTPNTLRGASPDALINARTVNDLPGGWFDYHTFDQKDRAQTSRALAFNAGWGRNGEAGQAMFDSVKRQVEQAKYKVKAAEQEILRINPQAKQKEIDEFVDAKLGADAANVRKYVKNQRVVQSAEDGLGHLFRRDNSPDGTVRFLVRAASTLGNMCVSSPSSAIVNMSRLLDLQLKYGASKGMIGSTGHMLGEFSKEMAASFMQSFGVEIFNQGQFHKFFVEDGFSDPGSYQKFTDPFDRLQGERLPAQIMRGISDTLQLGMAKPGAEHTVFRPAHLFTTVGMGIDKVGTMEMWRILDSHIARGVKFFDDHPALLNDPSFKLDAKTLGYGHMDTDSFNRLTRDIDNWGVNYNDAVHQAIARNDGTTLTKQQRARLSSLFDSEIANEGNFTTMPAASYNNSLLRACAPLLTWSFRRARQIMDLRLDPEGRTNMKSLAYGFAGLSVMAGGGLALSGLLQQYYTSVVGKSTNIRPILGEPSTKEEALAIMENLTRIGTVGMFGDIINSAFGEGGGGDNRMVSVDNRVVAIESLNNIFSALQSWTNQGQADYIHVVRPIMTSIGGGALLQYMEIANNALGLDNAEARQTARVNAENYLRVVGRQMELDVRKPDGGGANPTPTGPYLTQMELAAYLNSPGDFQKAWSQAVSQAKEDGKTDAADYVKRAFAARHPLRAVFKTPPSAAEYRELLANLPDSGRRDVSQAILLFNGYGAKLGLPAYDGKEEKKPARLDEPLTRSNPYALRQSAAIFQ